MLCPHRALGALPAFLVLAAPLAAQAPAAGAAAAAAMITADDYRRHIGIIAHDSMLGRDTPSRGLDLTAQYVADQFKAFGLKPGGDNGSYLQRYRITRTQLDVAASHLGFMGQGGHHHVQFATDAVWLGGPAPRTHQAEAAFVVGGALDPARVPAGSARGKVALVVVDYQKPRPATFQRLVARMLEEAAAVVVVSNRDSAQFATRVANQKRPRLGIGRVERASGPLVEAHDRAVAGPLAGFGVDVAAIRADTATVARDVPELKVAVDLKETVLSEEFAPNTVGILEGTDPVLKNEYVIYSAHMDHIGISRGASPDSINNGADDDASGTTGVIELARAMSQAPTRRSAIFLTVSGEEKGLWGSDYFVAHPPVPIGDIVADLNMDMIGRNWKDTIVVIGKEHSDLGATLARVSARHPELDMAVIDDRWPDENFYARSDHYNFARKGVPILFFFNGVHPDYHRPSDEVPKIDAEKASRILKLVFWLGQEVGNATQRPKWNPESYRKIVE